MKKLYNLILLALVVFSTNLFSQSYSGGSGTLGDPYKIGNKVDLLYLSDNYSGGAIYYDQVADILFDTTDFQSGGIAYNGGEGFNPIGPNFNGVYDGNNFIIQNIFQTSSSNSKLGLFGSLNSGIVRNLVLKDFEIINNTSNGESGIVSGSSRTLSIIENISVINSRLESNSSNSCAGGICGINHTSTISNCNVSESTISILSSSSSNVGGVCGLSDNSNILKSHVTQSNIVSSNSDNNAGGICGYAYYSTFELCKAEATEVSCTADGTRIGGLAGQSTGSKFSNCISISTLFALSRSGPIGGIIGRSDDSKLLHCSAHVHITGSQSSGGLIGTTIGTDSIMTSNSTGTINGFTNSNNHNGLITGGLIGYMHQNAILIKCYSDVNINSNWTQSSIEIPINLYSGGLVGICDGSVWECFSSGDVYVNGDLTSENAFAGGGIGISNSTSVIKNCYSKGNVTLTSNSTGYVAGFSVRVMGSTVSNSYSTGALSAPSTLNGFIESSTGPISNCFWDTESSGVATSAGGGTGETTVDMKNEATFTAVEWDFVGETTNGTDDIWKMDTGCMMNDGYPIFSWQTLAVDSATSAERCDSGTVTLYAGGSFGDIKWYDQPSGGNLLDSTFVISPAISATTNYYVVMEYNGCSSTVETSTGTVHIPTTSVTASGSTLTADASGITYQWLDCNNSNAVLSSEINQSYTAITNGNYAVRVEESGCVDTSSCVNVTLSSTANPYLNDDIKIYPNPVQDELTIDLAQDIQTANITVINCLGKTVKVIKVDNQRIVQLDLSTIPSGTYFVQIESSTQLNHVLSIQKL